MNTLYLGDCLEVLRESVPDESVDLIYIDPPFNSKRDYNIFFDDKEIQTQRIAFEDTWTLKNIQDSLAELHTLKTDNLYFLLLTYQKVAPHAFPYLTMMSLRILELHRVLKPTGSFYLHCDPTMSHYLKTVCDLIFEVSNYRSEITWLRSKNPKGSQFDSKVFSPDTDIILHYAKSKNAQFFYKRIKVELSRQEIDEKYDRKDKLGQFTDGPILRSPSMGDRPNLVYEYKGYTPGSFGWRVNIDKLAEIDKKGNLGWSNTGKPFRKLRPEDDSGKPIGNCWLDIALVNPQADERLGYPTQKPKALLERIIKASSNEGDTVLDGFCGCGTTVDAAEGLNRNWIGIDISPIAISLIKRRLKDTYGEGLSKFEVRGTPTTENSAKELWKQNPFAFQDWWLTEFEVFSTTYGKKGADEGIDGIGQYLIDPKDQKVIRAAFQVKGGKHVQSKDIDALLGAMEKHKCELGVFLTIAKPTKPMLETIAASGFVKIPGFKIPKLQILTLKDYFQNKMPKLPKVNITFKAAQLKGKKKKNQIKLDM